MLTQPSSALSRKDFFRRAGALLAPASIATAFSANAAESRPAAADPQSFSVRRFGAVGDGRTKDTQAIQAAIDAAGTAGGTVHFPAGKYLSGTVRLKSHVTLYLDAGAELVFSPDRADFDPIEQLPYKSFSDEETTDFHYALVRGQDVEHVGIVGPGGIDGNRTKRHGPKPIALKNCRHIAVRDITIRNSPNYNISLLGCEHINIEGVTILNGYCDGIDPDCCRHVRIANCYVESWDDAIVPKASFALGRRGLTENVTVTNCVLTTGCNCFKLGTESSGSFQNITVSNCAMFARRDIWRRSPTSGVSIEMVDGASIDRVAVSNLVMSNMESPIFIRLGNRGRGQSVPKPEHLQGISITDIVATGAERASLIVGIPGYPVKQITLRNIRVTSVGGGAAELARKVVPEKEDGYPDADMFGDIPAHGLFCRHAESLVLDNIQLQLEKADARPAMIFDQVQNLELRNSAVAPPTGTEPAIWLREVKRAFLQGLRAQPQTQVLARLAGAGTEGVLAVGNDFTEAAAPFKLEPEVNPNALRQEANFSR